MNGWRKKFSRVNHRKVKKVEVKKADVAVEEGSVVNSVIPGSQLDSIFKAFSNLNASVIPWFSKYYENPDQWAE